MRLLHVASLLGKHVTSRRRLLMGGLISEAICFIAFHPGHPFLPRFLAVTITPHFFCLRLSYCYCDNVITVDMSAVGCH